MMLKTLLKIVNSKVETCVYKKYHPSTNILSLSLKVGALGEIEKERDSEHARKNQCGDKQETT